MPSEHASLCNLLQNNLLLSVGLLCNMCKRMLLYYAQDYNVSPYLRIVDKLPSPPSPHQMRRLTIPTAADDDVGEDVRPAAALLLDQLLNGSETETNAKHPATINSLQLRRLVKRQPFQCLVNVVACWKR